MSAPTIIPDRFLCAQFNLQVTLRQLRNPNFTDDPACLAILLECFERETTELIEAFRERANALRAQAS